MHKIEVYDGVNRKLVASGYIDGDEIVNTISRRPEGPFCSFAESVRPCAEARGVTLEERFVQMSKESATVTGIKALLVS